jgi:hypothetical protein
MNDQPEETPTDHGGMESAADFREWRRKKREIERYIVNPPPREPDPGYVDLADHSNKASIAGTHWMSHKGREDKEWATRLAYGFELFFKCEESIDDDLTSEEGGNWYEKREAAAEFNDFHIISVPVEIVAARAEERQEKLLAKELYTVLPVELVRLFKNYGMKMRTLGDLLNWSYDELEAVLGEDVWRKWEWEVYCMWHKLPGRHSYELQFSEPETKE